MPRVRPLRNIAMFFVGALIALAALIAMGDIPTDEDLTHRQYCEMVALNRADPTVGWPDFNNSYDQECTHERDR